MTLSDAIKWQHTDKLFVSLAAKPGKTGETFYNTLFKHHNINAEYVACECIDLKADMDLVREHCAGASITMPFKRAVVEYVDMDRTNGMPINTVVNRDKFLIGFNCDFLGLQDLVGDLTDKKLVILGNGAMAENTKLLGVNSKITPVSRQNWHQRHAYGDILINATSVGMGTDECPVDRVNVDLVVDCVIGPTKLIDLARRENKQTITGAEIYVAQFKHQFKIYTGQEPDATVVEQVAKELFDV